MLIPYLFIPDTIILPPNYYFLFDHGSVFKTDVSKARHHLLLSKQLSPRFDLRPVLQSSPYVTPTTYPYPSVYNTIAKHFNLEPVLDQFIGQYLKDHIEPAVLAALNRHPDLEWDGFTIGLSNGDLTVTLSVGDPYQDGLLEFQESLADELSKVPRLIVNDVVEEHVVSFNFAYS